MTQDVEVETPGTYKFSMLTACRAGYSSGQLRLTVMIGDAVVCSDLAPGDSLAFVPHEFKVTLTAGSKTLKIRASDSPDYNGTMAFVDDVRLALDVDETEKIITGTAKFEKGAFLHLDRGVDVHFEEMLINDEKVRFNRKSQVTDIFIDGDGKVSAGDPLGLCIMLR